VWRSKFGDGGFTSYGVVRYITGTSKRREVEFMPGGNAAVKSQIWREVRFDENLKGYALCEDEDFSYRVSRNYKIIFTPEARLKHFQRPLEPLESKNLNRELIKNRYYLFKKNFPQTLRSRLGFTVMVIGILLHRLLNRNWAGARGVIEGCLAMFRPHQNQTAQYH
jgi:GT2 family glycosyltransferase